MQQEDIYSEYIFIFHYKIVAYFDFIAKNNLFHYLIIKNIILESF